MFGVVLFTLNITSVKPEKKCDNGKKSSFYKYIKKKETVKRDRTDLNLKVYSSNMYIVHRRKNPDALDIWQQKKSTFRKEN